MQGAAPCGSGRRLPRCSRVLLRALQTSACKGPATSLMRSCLRRPLGPGQGGVDRRVRPWCAVRNAIGLSAPPAVLRAQAHSSGAAALRRAAGLWLPLLAPGGSWRGVAHPGALGREVDAALDAGGTPLGRLAMRQLSCTGDTECLWRQVRGLGAQLRWAAVPPFDPAAWPGPLHQQLAQSTAASLALLIPSRHGALACS